MRATARNLPGEQVAAVPAAHKHAMRPSLRIPPLGSSWVLHPTLPPALPAQTLGAMVRAVRGIDRPFGGLRLVMCGDFFQ